MKNIFKYFMIIIFLFCCKNVSYAYNYSTNETIVINKYSGQVLKIIAIWWDKDDFHQSIDKYLSLYENNDKVYNILNKIKWNVSSNLEQKEQESMEIEKNKNSTNWYESKINFSDFKVNFDEVKKVWLWYYNDYRKNKWLNPYSYEWILDGTAEEWSDLALDRWYIDHRRSSWDAYYNYSKISSWFAKRWVVCKNLNRITFSENIWIWTYKCNDDDCSDELAKATKNVFNFFVNEWPWWAHYECVVNKKFSKIWLWISIKKVSSNSYKFYLTTHYCTELQ